MKVITKDTEVVCSVCGGRSTHPVIEKSAAPGAPDLDLRPTEPHRSSMEYWTMECPRCGYCNDFLNKPADFDHSYLKSEEYTGLGGIETDNVIAARLIKRALVNAKNHILAEAVQSYLYAAWCFDDDGDTENSRNCRMAAVHLIDENGAIFKDNENFIILKADLLRRSGEFERVIREYEGRKFSKIIFTVIAEFQVKLAKNEDSGVYKSSDIPGVAAK